MSGQSSEYGAQSAQESADRGWMAGPVSSCSGGSTHGPVAVHVIVRCACGAAFMSTDAGLALGMAQDHANPRNSGREAPAHIAGEPS